MLSPETDHPGNGSESWRSEADLDIPGVSMLSMLRFRIKPSLDIEDASSCA